MPFCWQLIAAWIALLCPWYTCIQRWAKSSIDSLEIGITIFHPWEENQSRKIEFVPAKYSATTKPLPQVLNWTAADDQMVKRFEISEKRVRLFGFFDFFFLLGGNVHVQLFQAVERVQSFLRSRLHNAEKGVGGVKLAVDLPYTEEKKVLFSYHFYVFSKISVPRKI